MKIFSAAWMSMLRSKRPGEIVSTAVVPNTSLVQLSTTMPLSLIAPTITQGTEVFNVDFTPKAVGNKVVVEVSLVGGESGNSGNSFNGALFVNNAVDSVAMDFIKNNDSGNAFDSGRIHILHQLTVTSLAALNFKVRAGMDSGTNAFLNKQMIYNSNSVFPAGQVSWIKIYEIQA